jgi:hypothetical protein
VAHPEQQEYCKSVRNKFPEYFKNVLILDIGSLDINGNNRYLFDSSSVYIGVDVALGQNVDFAMSPTRILNLTGFRPRQPSHEKESQGQLQPRESGFDSRLEVF